jgi:hypothetical protein
MALLITIMFMTTANVFSAFLTLHLISLVIMAGTTLIDFISYQTYRIIMVCIEFILVITAVNYITRRDYESPAITALFFLQPD